MAWLSLASLPLNTESFVVFGFGNAFACQWDWQKLEVWVEGVIHVNLHIFVSKSLGENVSADRNAYSGKSFGWLIFKWDLHFSVKIQVLRAFLGLIFARGIRRAETFLRRCRSVGKSLF